MDAYLEALKERDSWNLDFSFNYVRDTNVNNVGSERQVVLENGGVLTRSESMLPQTAHGLAYSLDISRDFNLWRSHYLTLGNEFGARVIGIIMNLMIFPTALLLAMHIKPRSKFPY